MRKGAAGRRDPGTAREFYTVLERLGADPELFAVAGSWRDTLDNAEILNVDRYRRVQRFVEAFFPRIGEFQRPPRHPKWHDVDLGATLPGWTRFEAAQAWLDSHERGGPRLTGTSAAEPAAAAAR